MIESVEVIGSGRVGSAVCGAARPNVGCARRAPTRTSSFSASRTGHRRGRGERRTRARGSRTSAVRRRWPPWRSRTAGSACIRCRRSPCAGARSSSTARGRRSRARTTRRRDVGTWLAETLGLRPFPLRDEDRAAYHAGAAIASNYLVTLRQAAGSLLEAAGAPPAGSRPVDDADDRERVRAHGADSAW